MPARDWRNSSRPCASIRSDQAALTGAGQACFALGDDRGAVRFLGRRRANRLDQRKLADPPEAADSRPRRRTSEQPAAPSMSKDIASKAVARIWPLRKRCLHSIRTMQASMSPERARAAKSYRRPCRAWWNARNRKAFRCPRLQQGDGRLTGCAPGCNCATHCKCAKQCNWGSACVSLSR